MHQAQRENHQVEEEEIILLEDKDISTMLKNLISSASYGFNKTVRYFISFYAIQNLEWRRYYSLVLAVYCSYLHQ